MLWSSYESVPEQLVSLPEQLVSLPEQLYVFRSSYKSSGTVRSLPEQFRKCYGSVTKMLRSSYETVPEQLVSVPEQLVSVPEQLLSLPEQL